MRTLCQVSKLVGSRRSAINRSWLYHEEENQREGWSLQATEEDIQHFSRGRIMTIKTKVRAGQDFLPIKSSSGGDLQGEKAETSPELPT